MAQTSDIAGEAARPEDPKGVSTIELFFDLIFVFAVTRTSELLQADHSPAGSLMALVVFVPVFWLWVGTTMFANLSEVETVRGRAVFFAVALSGLAMALALPESYADRGLIFAGAYWWGRLVLLFAVRRHPLRRDFVTFPVGAFVTGPLLVVGALLPSQPRAWLWGLVAVVELAVPFVRRRQVARTPFHVGHLAERYGTFVIIALGETIVATGVAAAEEHDQWMALASAALGLAVCCGLWWTYFDLAAGAIERGLAAATVPIEIIRPVLSYGHLAFVAGIIGVAAGIGTAVREPLEPLAIDSAALVFGGTAIFLGAFGFTRWRLLHTLAVPRLTGACASCLLVLLAPHVPGLASLGALSLVLLAVNVADHHLFHPDR